MATGLRQNWRDVYGQTAGSQCGDEPIIAIRPQGKWRSLPPSISNSSELAGRFWDFLTESGSLVLALCFMAATLNPHLYHRVSENTGFDAIQDITAMFRYAHILRYRLDAHHPPHMKAAVQLDADSWIPPHPTLCIRYLPTARYRYPPTTYRPRRLLAPCPPASPTYCHGRTL